MLVSSRNDLQPCPFSVGLCPLLTRKIEKNPANMSPEASSEGNFALKKTVTPVISKVATDPI